MTDITIRESKPADFDGIMALLTELSEVAGGFNINNEQARDHFLAMQAAPEFYLNLIAETEGKPVGFLSLIFFKTLFHRVGTAQINELVVTAGFRGQGIGGMLIQTAKEAALARGMDELEVSTEKENVYAQHFYQKMGFTGEYLLLGMEFEGDEDA